MSRKFSWHRSRHYSSGGLEVVPAEGIEVGFPIELKPLPEPPEKKPKFYDRTVNVLWDLTSPVIERVKEFQEGKGVGRAREVRVVRDAREELGGEEESGTSDSRWWRRSILGVQILWLVVGFAIFAFGLGIGGWMASLVVAGKRGGQVVVPGTTSVAPSSLLVSAVQTTSTAIASVSSTAVTSRSLTTSTRSALVTTASLGTTTATVRAASSTKSAIPATVTISGLSDF